MVRKMKPVSACSKSFTLRRCSSSPSPQRMGAAFVCPVAETELLSLCVLQVAVNSIFQEVTLRLDVSDQERRWLLEQTNHVEEKSYAELKQPAGALAS